MRMKFNQFPSDPSFSPYNVWPRKLHFSGLEQRVEQGENRTQQKFGQLRRKAIRMFRHRSLFQKLKYLLRLGPY